MSWQSQCGPQIVSTILWHPGPTHHESSIVNFFQLKTQRGKDALPLGLNCWTQQSSSLNPMQVTPPAGPAQKQTQPLLCAPEAQPEVSGWQQLNKVGGLAPQSSSAEDASQLLPLSATVEPSRSFKILCKYLPCCDHNNSNKWNFDQPWCFPPIFGCILPIIVVSCVSPFKAALKRQAGCQKSHTLICEDVRVWNIRQTCVT